MRLLIDRREVFCSDSVSKVVCIMMVVEMESNQTSNTICYTLVHNNLIFFLNYENLLRLPILEIHKNTGVFSK